MDNFNHGVAPQTEVTTLETLLRAAPVGVGVVSGRVFSHASPRLCEMVGYTREELLGQSTRLLYPTAEEFERTGRIYYRELSAHGLSSIETRWQRKDGVLIDVLISSSPTHPTELETAVIITVLDVSEARRSQEELVWRNRQLRAFQRISEVMLADEAEQSVFDTIAREAAEMSGFPLVTIELCDFDKAVMVFRGVHGISLEGMPTPFEVPMDVTLSGQVARTGEVLLETEVSGRREYAAPILRQLRVETCLCVPIKVDGKVIGTLSLSHPERTVVEPRVVTQVISLANYLATLFGRLLARDAVRRGEAELAVVYDRAPSIMCLFDEQLRIVRANRAAAEFTGRPPAELLTLRAGKFLECPNCAEADVECGTSPNCSNCSLRRAVTETFTSARNWQRVRVEKKLLRHGQEYEVVLLVSTERIQVDGMARVLMSLEDITASVRANEQIASQAALLDVTRDAIYVRDFSDRITYWNEGAQQLYGWTAAEVRGRTTSELLLPAGETQVGEAFQAVQQKSEWIGEIRQKTRDGRELIVQSRWTLVREATGVPKAILVVNTDITEKKQLEARLLRTQRLESIGTLASGLAHDLNNVLAPIMMAVNFLKEDARDENTRTWVETLETCSQRGANIIRQVLTFARGVEGTRVLLQPKHLIQEIERIITETFPRSIRIEVHLCKQPGVVTGDATQIQQVLMNLCVNARDAMPQGGLLKIQLDKAELQGDQTRLHPKAKAGNYVVIRVTDTGVGIPAELLDKIFDPFFTTKPLGHGTGLGLPTVLGITESHGGFVHVDSEPGRGTTFHVYLPAAATDQESEFNGLTQLKLPKGHNEVVLVVDDEPAIRQIANVILHRNGYRPLLAVDGQEALTVFRANQDAIQLVISDLMMPRLDGPALIQQLRQMKPGLKTITVTGLGEEGRISEAKAAGSDVVLSKPFTAEELLFAVWQLLASNSVG